MQTVRNAIKPYLQHIKDNTMHLLDSLLQLIAPHSCLGCSSEGALLCSGCMDRLVDSQPECYFCRQPMPSSLTCTSCYARAGLRQVVVGTLYDGVAELLVKRLKFSGAQAAVSPMVRYLSSLVRPTDQIVVVPVPTATTRVRRRGYDQAVLLARSFARKQGCAYLSCLQRRGQTHQVGADRRQRLAQLQGAFAVLRPPSIQGKSILLIDDVLTTGATFEAAAQVLLAAGAAQVSGLAFARGR